MDGQLDTHFVNTLEQKFSDTRFVRVDADVPDKLIEKDQKIESKLTQQQKEDLKPVFRSQLPTSANYTVVFEDLNETENPVVVTQSEFMRRMKEMSAMGGGMNIYGDLPDSYNLVVNSNHPLIEKILKAKDKAVGEKVTPLSEEIGKISQEKETLEKAREGKKEEEISQEEKDKLTDAEKKLDDVKKKKEDLLLGYGKKDKYVKQLIDLALLANNMLKGEDLTRFVKRSVELIK